MKRITRLLMAVMLLVSITFSVGQAEALSPDFREETIYFVITTRFYDGDPSNNVHCWDDATANNPDSDPAWRGDFEGLIQKLDYIKALGFSAIWITTIVKNASGYDYHGYHAINFKEIDPRYATKSKGETAEQSYKRLINEAHKRGMKVIQDIVINHSSNFGEENLFPMFKRNAPTGLNETINQALTKLPNPWLPSNYDSLTPAAQYSARITAMKEDYNDTQHIYHHEKSLGWESYTVQTGQIAGDCVDLNTENPTVAQYLIDAYNKYIDMGVDGFRVDTTKHVSRLSFNKYYIPAWKERGGENFFIFGEVCSRYRQVWNSNIPAISAPFYTWKESKSYPWGMRETNESSVFQHWNDNQNPATQPTSNNHLLINNTYRTPDWSKRSGQDVIDFPMHWNFANARDAFNVAVSGDQYYNDATWNVTYVDSHDYAPDTAPENQRFALSTDTWAENLSLMYTFRGIPTIFYGSEIEFQKGKPIDVGPNAPLSQTGRAYFGDHITGSVSVSDFGVWSNATGNLATTLNHPLSKHIQRLNRIRRAIPALQKGQYSTEGCNGYIAFKRRYTSGTVDSFALVTISGNATFTGIPNGTYRDAITGHSITVTNGTLTTTGCNNKGNMRIYVLNGPGKIGEDTQWLYGSGSSSGNPPAAPTSVTATAVSSSSINISWNASSGATSYTVYRSTSSNGTYSSVGTTSNTSYTDSGLSANTTYYYRVTAANSYGISGNSATVSATTLPGGSTSGLKVHVKKNSVANWSNFYCYYWGSNGSPSSNSWPGQAMTAEDNNWYVFTIPGASSSNVIFNNGSGSQTVDLSRSGEGWFVPTGTSGGKITGTWYSSNPDSGGSAPSAPTGVSANATSSSSITISWNAVSGATSYTVYRSSSSNGTYSSVGTTSSTSFTNTGLSANTTYYYKVTASNSYGTSGYSATVSAKTQSGGGAGGLKVHVKKNSVANWSNFYCYYWGSNGSPSSNNWPGQVMTAEGNNWYVFTIPGASSSNVIFNNGSGTQTVDLSRSGEGWFVPTGTSGGKIIGTWYSSNPDSGGSAPSAPTGVSANATSSSSITISWNAVSGATSYTVYRSSSSNGTYSSVGTTSSTSFTNTGLSANTTYYYRVTAANSYGISGNSATVSATTLPGGSTSGLKVHVKKNSVANWSNFYCYYWGSNGSPSSNNWPGQVMTAEGNNWYVFTIPGASSSNVIFNNGSGTQTVDLSRSGEGWFVPTGTSGGKIIGTWYSSNPDSSGGGGSTGTTTTIRVQYDVGSGNSIYIRGNVSPLSWDTGVAATRTTGNVWVYTTTDIPEGQAFEFKPLINDSRWSTGSNFTGVGGQTITITPNF